MFYHGVSTKTSCYISYNFQSKMRNRCFCEAREPSTLGRCQMSRRLLSLVVVQEFGILNFPFNYSAEIVDWEV